MRKFLLVVALCGLCAWLFILYKFHSALTQNLALKENRTLLVGKGDTLSKVIRNLEAEGVLHNAQWLIWHAQLNEATLIRTGEYELVKDITGESLLERLSSGRVIQYQITFVEGTNLRQVMQSISSQPKLINDVVAMSPAEYEKFFGFTLARAEGWFFPDTYSYVSGTKASEVLMQSHRRLRFVLDREWEKRDKSVPYSSPYEALIMASIIEKETGAAHEREEISGVFVRRLKKGMKLQTDPTVIYGMGSAFQGNLKRSHLREPTPYNTYVIDGLPPTPIALVGRAAIHAALHPASGTTLFFVAKGDGTHFFSTTLAEHENAIREYQLKRKAEYRSSVLPLSTSDDVEGEETAPEDNPTKDNPSKDNQTEAVAE